MKVFVEKRIGERLHRARDENYKIILVKCGKEDLGREITVKVINAGLHTLIGEKIEDEKEAS